MVCAFALGFSSRSCCASTRSSGVSWARVTLNLPLIMTAWSAECGSCSGRCEAAVVGVAGGVAVGVATFASAGCTAACTGVVGAGGDTFSTLDCSSSFSALGKMVAGIGGGGGGGGGGNDVYCCVLILSILCMNC